MSRPEFDDGPVATRLPILKDGDRLDRAAFHERYRAMPPDFRAELIEGVVVVSSPVGFGHGRAHKSMTTWIGVYQDATPGTEAVNDATVMLDDVNEPQPDASLFVESEYRGRTRIEDDHIVGAPELVVEISASSAARDLGAKLRAYERAGVEEYIAVLLHREEIRWRKRIDGRLVEIAAGVDGLYRSTAFPGLWLNPSGLFDPSNRSLLQGLRRGLESPEHAEFARRLADGRKSDGG